MDDTCTKLFIYMCTCMISIVYMYFYCINRIGGVMVNVFASSVVDRGFELQLGQTKDCKIGICCFSVKHVALRSKGKDMSTSGLLFQ